MFDRRSALSPGEVAEALDWVLLLQQAEDRAPWRVVFERWVAADPRHDRAFREIRIAWAFVRLARSGATPAEKQTADAILQHRAPLFGIH